MFLQNERVSHAVVKLPRAPVATGGVKPGISSTLDTRKKRSTTRASIDLKGRVERKAVLRYKYNCSKTYKSEALRCIP